MLFWPFMGSINTLLASAVLTNSKFGLFYSNFLILTPTFSKVPIEKIGKTLNFSGKQQFNPIVKILVRDCQRRILSSADDLCSLDLNQAR